MFSQLVKIIEKYNGIYGWVTLFSVFTGVLHFSVDMFTIFKVESYTLERILFLSDFVWFGCILWGSAQVYEKVRPGNVVLLLVGPVTMCIGKGGRICVPQGKHGKSSTQFLADILPHDSLEILQKRWR